MGGAGEGGGEAPSTRLNKCLHARSAARVSRGQRMRSRATVGNMCFRKLRLALRKHVNKHNKTQTESHLPAEEGRPGWHGPLRSRRFVTLLKKS